MNIAHLLPYSAQFPLTKHNGRYEWALRLARLQVAKGHNVTIYAAPESHDSSASIVWRSHTSNNIRGHEANNLENIRTAFLNPEHDIYHSHFDFLHYLLADTTRKPIVCTQHWFPTLEVAEAAKLNLTKNVVTVPVTHFMAEANKKLSIPSSDVIYHGIDLGLFKPTTKPKSDRFIFVGRIAPHKGVKEAVEIAKAANISLDIIGKINDIDQAYWQSILPAIDGDQIRYLGPKTQVEVADYFANAKCLLFPVQTLEAFGQTTVEAQACGTPVIIQDLGASNELVKNGETGFVVSTMEEYIQAIRSIDTIKPENCRSFAGKFEVQHMAAQYDTLYRSLIHEYAALA